MSQILRNKLEQLTRLIYVNSISKWNKSVLIVEYPKSGGTWLGQLLSEALNLPFPRNKMPVLSQSIYHSHYLPQWRIPKNNPILYLVRDGRDVMISKYFHELVWNEKNKLNPKNVYYHRSMVPFEDYRNIHENLYDYINYEFEYRPSKPQQFTYMGNWCEYNRTWLGEMKRSDHIYLIKYEDLLEDTAETLDQLLKNAFGLELSSDKLQLIVEKYSFENQTKRKRGVENKGSFLRKGVSGDWKNYFGSKEKELFKQNSGDLLIELGYEKSKNW